MGKVEVDGEELESKKEMLKVIGRRILASYHEPITLRQHEDFKKEHGEIAVELDALDPDILEEMIEESMMEYYDSDKGSTSRSNRKRIESGSGSKWMKLIFRISNSTACVLNIMDPFFPPFHTVRGGQKEPPRTIF